MGIPTSISALFSKGDNYCDFLFAYLEDEVLSKWGLLLKEFALMAAKSFLHKMTQFIWEATMKITELLPLKVYPFTLS